jgi:hypothetical protein
MLVLWFRLLGAHLYLTWWLPNDSVHLFKSLVKRTQADRSNSKVKCSLFSVAKLFGEDVALFAKR